MLGLLFLLNQPLPAPEGVVTVPISAEGEVITFSIWAYNLALILSYFCLMISIYLFLKVQKKSIRTLKTLLGYLAVELMFLVAITVMKQTGLIPIIVLLLLWKFVAQANVIKNALGTQMAIGVLLAINLEVIKFIPFMVLFAPQLGQIGGAS